MTQLKLKAQPPPLERHDQEALFKWLMYQRYDGLRIGEYAFAVPNGSYLHGGIAQRAIQGEALKRQGVKSGVPDVAIPIPVAPYHGLWIELKRRGNKPSSEQDDWHTRLRARGYAVYVTYGLDQAMAVVREYFGLEGTP